MGFLYLWRDSLRGMYYIGSHDGKVDDGYLSSSRWLNGEIRYRPQDFRRRVLCHLTPAKLRKTEHKLIKSRTEQLGTKYYNIPTGKPKGHVPWNKGRKASEAQCRAQGEGVRRARAARSEAQAAAHNEAIGRAVSLARRNKTGAEAPGSIG